MSKNRNDNRKFSIDETLMDDLLCAIEDVIGWSQNAEQQIRNLSYVFHRVSDEFDKHMENSVSENILANNVPSSND